MKVSELKSLPPKILLYGPSGCGKTAFFLTAGSRAEIIDLDGNLDVGLGLEDNFSTDRLEVEFTQCLDDYPERITAFTLAEKRLREIKKECKAGTYPYDVLGIDSLTALAQAAQNLVMKNSNMVGQNPQIQHFGMFFTMIENFLALVRSLPIPVVVIAHQMQFTNPDEETSRVQIAIPGQKLPDRITRMFSEIWYVRLKPSGGNKQIIYIQTCPSRDVTCRSGRGLENGFEIGEINPKGGSDKSISLWKALEKINFAPATSTPTPQ